MKNFTFSLPTKVVFGKDAHLNVGSEIKNCGGTKALLHYGGSSAKKSGLIDQVCQHLKEENIECVQLGGVVPNPRLSLVNQGIELCKQEKIDFILAIGGGSVIDSAKAIALALANDCDPWDMFDRLVTPKACLPLGVILTIAASGSETSKSSIITNEDGWQKRGYANDLMRPKFALLNPELTYSLPMKQTVYGVVDIMMHTMERYFTAVKNVDLTDAMCEALLKTVIKHGKIVVNDPNNYDTRAELMWAGSISHNDLLETGRVGDYAVHQLEHELGGMFDVDHAAGLSAIWASWARFVYKADVARFVQYAVNVWNCDMDFQNPENTALQGIKASEEFFASLGMPISLKELLAEKGINEITEEQMREMAQKSTYGGKREIGNFVRLSEDDMVNIFKTAWDK